MTHGPIFNNKKKLKDVGLISYLYNLTYIGNIDVGNISNYLPFLLHKIKNQRENQYLLLCFTQRGNCFFNKYQYCIIRLHEYSWTLYIVCLSGFQSIVRLDRADFQISGVDEIPASWLFNLSKSVDDIILLI